MAAKSVLVALGVLATVSGALAAEPAREAPRQAPKQVCREATRTLGSHIRTARRCRTPDQLKEEEETPGALPIGAQVTAGQNDGQAGRQPQ